MKKILILALSALSVTAFAQAPSWFNTETRATEYPDSKYITGYVGRQYKSSDNIELALQGLEEAAKEKAKSEFRVQIVFPSIHQDLIRTIETTSYKSENEVFSPAKPALNKELPDLQVESWQDTLTHTIAAFAYIEKNTITRPLEKLLIVDLTKIEAMLDQIDKSVLDRQIPQAREMAKKVPALFNEVYETQKMLAALDVNADEASLQMRETRAFQQRFVGINSEIQKGIKYTVNCHAYTVNGQAYDALGREINGALSKYGYTPTIPSQSDYTIRIGAHVEEPETRTSKTRGYYIRVYADLTIERTATGERIYQDRIEAKGGDTNNYKDAARDGFNKLSLELSNIIIKQIQK